MAFSGSQITRLGLAAFARALYGSFAGKAEKITIESGIGVIAMIDARGQSKVAEIDETGESLEAAI